MLSDVDPDFIEKYVPRKSLLDLNYFPVTPNGHRVTEFSHRPSNGPKLSFVSIFLFSPFLQSLIFINCHRVTYIPIFNVVLYLVEYF